MERAETMLNMGFADRNLDSHGNICTQLSAEDLAIRRAEQALLKVQHGDGFWCFDLESDPGISADYLLMMHYMDEVDETLQA